MKRRRNVPPALGMCVFSAIGLYGLCPRGTGFVQVYFQKTNPAGEAVHRLERHMDEMERPLRTDIAIPLLQSVGLFLNLCGDLPAGFQGDLSGFTHSKQISKTGVFPISIHRRGVFAKGCGAPRQIIGRGGMPAVLRFIVEPTKVFGMVIAVVGKDIEAHAAVHLFRVGGVAA